MNRTCPQCQSFEFFEGVSTALVETVANGDRIYKTTCPSCKKGVEFRILKGIGVVCVEPDQNDL